MKKALIILTIAAAAAFAGCGDSSSQADKVTESQVQSSSAVQGEKAVKDVDVLGGVLKGGGEKWFGLTRDEVSKKSGGEFDKANAKDSTDEYDYFYLGEQSAVSGGKAELGGSFPIYLQLNYKDGKLSKVTYSIDPEETVEKADEKPVLEALSKYLEQNVPDGFTKKAGSGAKGKGSFNFFNGDKNSYIFEVSVSSGVGSTNFPVKLSVETYADKYGQ